jgi:hypothetical protein
MPLHRNKQLALYVLLATRSGYRYLLEGKGSDPAEPPLSGDGLLQRFLEVPRPHGITAEEMKTLTGENLYKLFVPVKDPAAPEQQGNITTNPYTIAEALGIIYDIQNPDCPCYYEGNLISKLLIENLPEVKPGRPGMKYIKQEPEQKP